MDVCCGVEPEDKLAVGEGFALYIIHAGSQ